MMQQPNSRPTVIPGPFRIAWAGFSAVAICFAAVIFYWIALQPLWLLVDSGHWVRIPCIIQNSKVKAQDMDEGEAYAVGITFSYQYNGVPYRGGTYDFTAGFFDGRRVSDRIAGRYHRGMQSECFVNPRNPTQAVLSRGIYAWPWLFLPVIFLAAGFFFLDLGRQMKTWPTRPEGTETRDDRDASIVFTGNKPGVQLPARSKILLALILGGLAVMFVLTGLPPLHGRASQDSGCVPPDSIVPFRHETEAGRYPIFIRDIRPEIVNIDSPVTLYVRNPPDPARYAVSIAGNRTSVDLTVTVWTPESIIVIIPKPNRLNPRWAYNIRITKKDLSESSNTFTFPFTEYDPCAPDEIGQMYGPDESVITGIRPDKPIKGKQVVLYGRNLRKIKGGVVAVLGGSKPLLYVFPILVADDSICMTIPSDEKLQTGVWYDFMGRSRDGSAETNRFSFRLGPE